jgi:hypothetical protein
MRANAILTAALAAATLRRSADPVTAADVHAANAESAAHVAVQAAKVSNQVATHATEMNVHAQEALRHAHGALHEARTDTEGMTAQQRESLEKADAELKIATKKLESEELEQTEWVQGTLADADAADKQHAATTHLNKQIHDLEIKISAEMDPAIKAQLEQELAGLKHNIEVQSDIESQQQGTMESIGKMKDDIAKMQHQVDILDDIKATRAKLGGDFTPTNSSTTITMDGGETVVAKEENFATDLDDLKGMMKSLEHQHELGAPETASEDKALQDELMKLKKAIAESIVRQEDELQANKVAQSADFVPVGGPDIPAVRYTSSGASAGVGGEFPDAAVQAKSVTPVGRSSTSMDIDTEMPYGELEPFGREDTAAELTAASIAESDKMVDQIEKAEVAEEKRSVFRALTRLRGAAITSYDGVARSQTGNIDEYNHVHKWRETHPLHHLADEESDVSKWAFPDNAD